ncbi:tail protein X [Serratia sp. MF2]|uniref:tail protein X n=1 Tax=Serratia sp. MF1(2023) TaxID=3059171 RepID=UPI0027E8547E|nr:tail protein X [Serratia sp. MF1(2023)]MDQ7104213.1 tail protein X [Serratia sp. MF1(2023)]
MQWEYITEQGDTWDVLALDIYGSEKLAHILQSANPDYLNLIFFPAGITLTVPETPALESNLPTPPWVTS